MKNIFLTALFCLPAFAGYFSLSAGGGGGITTTEPIFTATTAFRAADGVVGTPSFSFTNETGLGCYRVSAGTMRCASSGTDRFQISSVGVTVLNSGVVRSGVGAVTQPSYTIDGDGNTGWFTPSADVMNFVTNGANRGGYDSSGNWSLNSATANRVPYFDASKNLVTSAVTDTELGFLSGVTSAVQTQLNAKVTGPASAVDSSIPAYDSTTGKLIKDPAQFFIDSTNNDLYCVSGERCNVISTSQTVLTSEETFRGTTALGTLYAQNNAGSRSVRVGSASSTGTRVGLYFYHPTNSKIGEITTQSSGFADLETFLPVFPPDFDSTDSDFHLFFNKTASNATTIGLSMMMNGTIWQFARNDGSGNFPVIVTNDPTNTYGVQTRYHGMRMDVINATNLAAYGSPANGFEMYFQGSDYLTGTGNGGQVRLLGGQSTGGTGGHVVLEPGDGSLDGVTKSVRGFAHTPATVSVTADAQSVTVQNGVLVFSSDDATATNRTIVLADGTADGQVAQFIFSDATDAIELVDDDTQFCGSATWTPTDRDSLSVTWVASMSCWVESSRSVN